MDLTQYYYLDTITKITDKGWHHGYIEHYYNFKFTNLKIKPMAMLELGVHQGQSIRLWSEWFENTFIYGIDINLESIKKIENFHMVKGIVGDGYTSEMVDKFDDGFFDIIIEDGPHTLDSQIFAAKNWVKKLKKNGFMVIEDIQDISHVEIIINSIPPNYAFKSFDLRSTKNRYDDIILEITKL